MWNLLKKTVKSPQVTDTLQRERPRRVFGRSLHIRHLDSGSCNGCDFELTMLNNAFYDIQQYGFDFVASPRHADLLVVTGGVTRHLEKAVFETFQATPDPKVVVAIGDCACTGGEIGCHYATLGGIRKALPVDVYIPGCPPAPEEIIEGLFEAASLLHDKEKER